MAHHEVKLNQENVTSPTLCLSSVAAAATTFLGGGDDGDTIPLLISLPVGLLGSGKSRKRYGYVITQPLV